MYLPEIFEVSDPDILYTLIRQHPFATLVTTGHTGIEANHLPFELLEDQDGIGTLLAHIAKNNPLSVQVEQGSEVLVIFQGEHGYISPNWYPTKSLHHQHVPTWNYQAVHIKGKISFIKDEKFLRGVLARLTRTHEATQDKPWKMSDAPASYIHQQLEKIVGIQITEMTGKFKLGQNRERVDLDGAIQGLKQQGEKALATVMQLQQD